MPNQNNKSPSNETENYEYLNIASRVDRQQDNPTTTNTEEDRIEEARIEEDRIEEDRTQNTNSANDGLITIRAIIQQISEETHSEQEWLRLFNEKCSQRFKRIPRGGWRVIHAEYNQNFNKNDTLVDLKNKYSRWKKQTRNIK